MVFFLKQHTAYCLAIIYILGFIAPCVADGPSPREFFRGDYVQEQMGNTSAQPQITQPGQTPKMIGKEKELGASPTAETLEVQGPKDGFITPTFQEEEKKEKFTICLKFHR